MKSQKTLLVLTATLTLFALLSACSGGAAPTQGPDLAGTQAALESTQHALETQQAQPAAATEEPAAEEPTAEPQPTEEPVVVSEDEPFYTEEFDTAPQNWTYFLYRGEEADFDLYTQRGRLVFDIPGQNVWSYYRYDSYTYTDVRLDGRAENLGNNNNNVSMFCRANDRGWYEFNVANNGLYWIYRYDVSTDTFNELYSGGVANLREGKDTNDFTIICAGDRLTLGVNGEEIRTVEDSAYDEGYAGIGVSSFSGVPVLVEFEYVTISTP